MSTVTLPLWLVVLVGALALIGLLDRLLVPSVRWFIRSRASKVLDEVGSRLRIEIRPFQQTHRQVLVDRLLYDEKVQQAAAAFARGQNMPREVIMAQIRGYAREIVPAFNAYFYFRVGYWLGRRIAQSLYRVRVGYTDSEGLARVPPNATVVFVMNHRSNMDYILAAYLVADQAALSYAVGEWARIWPLQQLIRSMGAYFVRRNSRDELYRKVLERYIVMATEAGVTQAVYPEGGLTRDGRMRAPKLGALDYMVRGFNPAGERDLVFIPLGINYDRTLEDRSLLLGLDENAKKTGALRAAWNTLAFAAHQARLMIKSEWHRFGYACVNFGTPLSMREFVRVRGFDFRKLAKEERYARMAELGDHLMQGVGKLIPVLPVPLVALVFERNAGQALSELEIKSEVESLIERLEAASAHIYIPRRDRDYAITAGLRMLLLRHIVEERDGLYAAVPAEAALLRYYANSIAHLLAQK
ncbi:MAG: 1-acyl-sn-glycerol-3-phosphate acyltransferase [Betaproteobacteria bacterium]|nr:1-acyl-sn-glycerol-3-phosphate acyltransferase [Betaproteobacteria bacterium]